MRPGSERGAAVLAPNSVRRRFFSAVETRLRWVPRITQDVNRARQAPIFTVSHGSISPALSTVMGASEAL